MSLLRNFLKPAPETILAIPGPGARNFLQFPGQHFLGNGSHPIKVPKEHRQAVLDQGWAICDPEVPPREATPEECSARQLAQEKAGWHKLPAGAPLARVIGPLSGPFAELAIEGRRYESGGGRVQVVPAEDARILAFNGWTHLGACGPTGSRPARPPIGEPFFDLTLGAPLIFDGAAWRDTVTGAAS